MIRFSVFGNTESGAFLKTEPLKTEHRCPTMETNINNQIIIVTGLPRSGTSMMMKMLAAGGITPLCDGLRTADSDNPNGYYEFERVKTTKEDPSWLDDAPGKAVKMVYSLLYDLPERRLSLRESSASFAERKATYNVLFMRRDLSEILASQRRMLANMKIDSPIDDDRMGQLFEKEITRFQAWVADAAHINCLEVLYNDVASGRVEPLEQINSHLGGGLSIEAMSAVVDPSLYRNRAAA